MLDKLSLILEKEFRKEPYHNFNYILGRKRYYKILGGICSDRAISLNNILISAGYESEIYSAYINNEPLHKVVKVTLNKGDSYLLDTGLGWPIVQLMSTTKSIDFKNYGLHYTTEIANNELTLFRITDSKQLVYKVKLKEHRRDLVIRELNDSYSKKLNYPFKDSIRFSQIVNDEFYFLKGKKFYFSESNTLKFRYIQSIEEFEYLFKNIFNFDLEIALEVALVLKMF